MFKCLFRLLLLAALGVLMLVGLAEAALWLLAPVDKRVSQKFEFDNQLTGLHERVSFMVDGRSMRTWKPSTEESSGPPVRVLVLGGGASVAFLQNDADTWWGQLGGALQKEFPGASFQISTLSREYTTILEAAKWAEKHMAALKPDVVIALFGFEDLMAHNGAYVYAPDKLATVTIETTNRGPWKEFLVDKSQLCRRLVNRGQKRALMAKLGPLGERNAYAQRLAQHRQLYAQLPLAYEVDRPEGRDPIMEYLDGLRALAALSQRQGAALIVIGEPSLHRGLMDGGSERLVHRWFLLDPAKGEAGAARLDSGWIELQLSRYYTAAEKLCASLGIPFLDPTRKMPANPTYFVDDVMLTDQGATTLAQLVLPLVKPVIAKRVTPP